MKNQKRYLLLFLFVWMTLFNTAFVLNSPVNTSSNVSAKTIERTPQYKASKLPFSQKLILKSGLRKIKKRLIATLDFDKLAKQSRLFAGLTSLNVLLTLSFIKIFPAAILLMIALTLILGLIAAGKANRVTDNTSSTDAQKKMAKTSRVVGCSGFMLLVICLVAAIFIL
jgi:hypothetical protein